MMSAKEDLLFVKQDDLNSLDGDAVSPAPSSDQLDQDFSDVRLSPEPVGKRRKLVESEDGSEDADAGMSPRKQLQIAQHHNNNDVSFVLIDDDGGGGTGPEDLASGDEEVSQLPNSFMEYFLFP